MEQKSFLFNQSNIFADDKVKFMFAPDGTVGGSPHEQKLVNQLNKLNKSEDYSET